MKVDQKFRWLAARSSQRSESGATERGRSKREKGARAMNPADLEGLPEEDKQRMLGMIENMQMKDR